MRCWPMPCSATPPTSISNPSRTSRIRYRIDGVLGIRALHMQYWPAMVVRIKVMSQMNIAETRAPQDGRISLSLTGRVVDFRASPRSPPRMARTSSCAFSTASGHGAAGSPRPQEAQLGLLS